MPLAPRRATVLLLLALVLGAASGAAARALAPRPVQAQAAPAVQAAPDAVLSEQAVAQAEAFRDKLLDWTTDMERVMPRLTEVVEPQQDGVLSELAADVEALEPSELLELEATMSHHPGYWELPAFLYAVVEPSAPVPPFYAELVLVWEASGELSSEEADALLDRPIGSQRPPAVWEEPPARATQESRLPRLPGIALPDALAPDAVNTPNPTPTAPYPSMPLFPPRGDLPAQPPSRPNCPGPFDGNTCGACPDRIPLGAIFAIKTALNVAERVKESFDPDQENCVCPAPGVPVCTYVPNPVYYVANSIRIALDATLRGLEFANALSLECETNYIKGIVDLFLDATVSSRVTQASLDAHAMLMMQVEIEQNLQEQADDRIGLFQLPQRYCSVQAVPDDTMTMTGFEGFRFCGKLELVRQIVFDTIERSAGADMLVDIAGARAELDAGDMHYMNDQWKSAYERYSKAYRAAVQEESRR